MIQKLLHKVVVISSTNVLEFLDNFLNVLNQ